MSVKWFGKQVTTEMKKRQYIALNKAGVTLERYIKLSMTRTEKQNRGSLRQKGRGKRPAKYHHPSMPGHPPAVDTDRLRASITFQCSDGTGSKIGPKAHAGDEVSRPNESWGNPVCVVGTNVEYGRYLELGTQKIKPRPFLRPALENNMNKILRFFNQAHKDR